MVPRHGTGTRRTRKTPLPRVDDGHGGHDGGRDEGALVHQPPDYVPLAAPDESRPSTTTTITATKALVTTKTTKRASIAATDKTAINPRNSQQAKQVQEFTIRTRSWTRRNLKKSIEDLDVASEQESVAGQSAPSPTKDRRLKRLPDVSINPRPSKRPNSKKSTEELGGQILDADTKQSAPSAADDQSSEQCLVHSIIARPKLNESTEELNERDSTTDRNRDTDTETEQSAPSAASDQWSEQDLAHSIIARPKLNESTEELDEPDPKVDTDTETEQSAPSTPTSTIATPTIEPSAKMAAADVMTTSAPDLADDHPSLSASLEDFEHNGTESEHGRLEPLDLPLYESGIVRSDEDEYSIGSDSGSAFFPPGELRYGSSSGSGMLGWSTHQAYQQDLRSPSLLDSRLSYGRSIEHNLPDELASAIAQGATEASWAARVQLPPDSSSDRSRSPSLVPDPPRAANGDRDRDRGGGAAQVENNGQDQGQDQDEGRKSVTAASSDAVPVPVSVSVPVPAVDPRSPERADSYIRFAVRAEVLHRIEPFEAVRAYLRRGLDRIPRYRISISRASKFGAALIGLSALLVGLLAIAVARIFLDAPPPPPPSPNLVAVASMARSLEPMIYLSENHIRQLHQLRQMSYAVSDLAESAKLADDEKLWPIGEELKTMSKLLNQLDTNLITFFTRVDGDVDYLLTVMDWASRELRQVSDRPTGTLTNGFGNIHGALCRIGVLQNAAGDPTALGSLSTVLFGRSYEQRTQRTLLFTFHHFVDMLEYIIDKELKALAGFEWRFDQLDTLFGMVREMVTGQTELKAQEEGELLASLWKNILGSRAEKDYVRRLYKKNHDLLLDVRRQTLGNRRVLVQHGSELLTVKVNLETLRDALVKPLVRSNDSSTLTIAEQVLGIDSYTRPLRAARERQRDIVYAVLSGHAPPQVPEIGGPVITARRAPRDD